MERPDLDDRFWSKVDRSGGPEGCWLWTAARDTKGYGRFTIRVGRKWTLFSAHRLTCETEWGPIPDGLCVLHRCDNPPCCNPAHLFVGTYADNIRDSLAKDRYPVGERRSDTVLTDADVRSIRDRYAEGGVLQRELAAEFGVSRPRISKIVNRKTWAHLDRVPSCHL